MAKKTAVRHVQTSVCELLEPRLFLSTTMFREGGGAGYVNATFDDAEITSATDTPKGTDATSLTVGGTKYGLLGVNDLFSLLPKTANGQLINVSQAKLHLFRYNTGTSANTISVFRATTDWMVDAAGSSESDVTFQHRDKSADLHWAGGNFSSSDYDSANGATTNFVSNYNQEVVIDITSLVQTMYQNEVNDGFVIYASSSSNFRPSENGSSTIRPALEITYTYVDMNHTLTVNSGSGDGSYAPGAQVGVSADAAPTGQTFDVWTGDTAGLASTTSASTTYTMPSVDASITATYEWINRTLTVNSGSGDGSTYHYGEVINVSADAPQSGYAFYCWTGDTTGLSDVFDSTTTYTMPNGSAAITAQFSPVLDVTDKLRDTTTAGYVTVTFDDAQLTGNSDTANGTGGNLLIRNDAGSSYKVAVMGMKDLFTLIPASQNGQNVQILEAKLHIYRYNSGTSSDTVYVNRLTSNWMTGTAGTNEVDVTFLHRDKSADLHWAAGNFSGSDYDGTVTGSSLFSDTYNGEVVITVTDLLGDIYDTGVNNGLVLRTNATGHDVAFRSAEASDAYRPYLEITYSYGTPTPMHWLNVDNGSGDGFHWEGKEIAIAADSPGSGQAFNMWVGDVGTHNGDTMLDWANQLNASETYTMPKYDATIAGTYRDADRPTDWVPRWDWIVNKEFGAEKEALTYEAFGSTVAFEGDGLYQFVSETSTYLTCETNLPTTGYIEYGTTASYGSQVSWADRATYLHGFYLTGLNNNTTYHYRYVMTDERGNDIASSDATFTTATPANVNYISGGHYTSPYVISASGYYLLTGDVTADYTAFEITANNVTLDLGGHTVVYNDVDYQVSGDNFPDFIASASYGVKATYKTGINIHNGTIIQGDGANAACTASIGYSPIFLRSSSGEVTGITAEQCGSQVQGIHLYYSSNVARFNIINDRGGEMTNRMAPVSAINTDGNANHNLVLRSRQVGITTSNNKTYYDNEIYVDSVCTNSFGLYAYAQTGINMYENRIFGGGYLMIGIGTVSSCSNISVTDNFVHLQADEPDSRWPEYGAQAGVNGIRQCWGGQNLNYTGNYLIAYGQDGGYARGLWEYQDPDEPGVDDAYNSNITFTNNVFKAYLFNSAAASDDGAIIITGSGDTSTAAYVTFTNNRIMSNFININHGTSLYGVGCNARYIGNTIIKLGDRADYRTINIPSGTAYGHQFFDTTFEGGASFDSYTFSGTGTRNFAVGWSLHLDTGANAVVTIRNAATNAIVFTGTADANGDIEVVDANGNPILLQFLQDPTTKTNYSYNIESIYGGITHTLNGVVVDELDEVRSL